MKTDKKTKKSILALSAALLLAMACNSGSDTQLSPIGSRCDENSACGTTPFLCNKSLPGGYCEKTCGTDGDCPSDAVCFVSACRRRCTDSADCRMSEGYACRAEGATATFCDVPATP